MDSHNKLGHISSWGGAKTLGSFEPAGNPEPEPDFENNVPPLVNWIFKNQIKLKWTPVYFFFCEPFP